MSKPGLLLVSVGAVNIGLQAVLGSWKLFKSHSRHRRPGLSIHSIGKLTLKRTENLFSLDISREEEC